MPEEHKGRNKRARDEVETRAGTPTAAAASPLATARISSCKKMRTGGKCGGRGFGGGLSCGVQEVHILEGGLVG